MSMDVSNIDNNQSTVNYYQNSSISNNSNVQVKTQELPKETTVETVKTDNLDDRKKTGENLSISEEAVLKAIEKANKAVEGVSKYCEFSIHKKTHQIVVKVFNKENGELIKEIPSEKVLDMVDKMCEMAGLFVDEKR